MVTAEIRLSEATDKNSLQSILASSGAHGTDVRKFDLIASTPKDNLIEIQLGWDREIGTVERRQGSRSVRTLDDFDRKSAAWRSMSNAARQAAINLRAVVLSKANQVDFPITGIAVDMENDPEGGSIVYGVRITTTERAGPTLAFWNSLAGDLELWLQNLRGAAKTIGRKSVGLRFSWAPPAKYTY